MKRSADESQLQALPPKKRRRRTNLYGELPMAQRTEMLTSAERWRASVDELHPLDMSGRRGWRALRHVVRRNDLALVEVILRTRGINPCMRGGSLLRTAVRHGNTNVLRALIPHATVGDIGRAIDTATKYNRPRALLLLLSGHTASSSSTGDPMRIAVQRDNRTVARILLKHGGGADRGNALAVAAGYKRPEMRDLIVASTPPHSNSGDE